jgi:hypothetical protein
MAEAWLLAHTGHALASFAYVAPMAIVLGALVFVAARERRKG